MLTERERERYARQILLFGEEGGQERLKKAKVFIAGGAGGGLGCPIALYLAVAGVGDIRLVDRDTVERTNLNRQVLHWERDLGTPKAGSAEAKLREANPDIRVEALAATIDEANVRDLVGEADLIVDAMDNFPTRYLLNRERSGRVFPPCCTAQSGDSTARQRLSSPPAGLPALSASSRRPPRPPRSSRSSGRPPRGS